MKTYISPNKKIPIQTIDKKTPTTHNPYNDLPIHTSPSNKAALNKIIKTPVKNIEMSKSPALKNNKIGTPDVGRVVGASASSNNDSLSKIKYGHGDAGKTGLKKVPLKNEKYNDYFDMDGPNGKPGKYLVNLSKKSADSNNSSVKSVQSENKKTLVTHR